MTMNSAQISQWFRQARKPQLARDQVMELYFTFHPRTAFLKTLPAAARLVDIGAGDGTLSVFRSWPQPARKDLELYAYSIEKGKLFDDFSGFEISDWNLAPPEFKGTLFDAVVCAHFIEHIAEPASFVHWCQRKLKPGARVYVEWPSPASLDLPPRDELESLGVPLMVSRFDDDHTHRALPDRDAMQSDFASAGFVLETQGIIRLPLLEEEMLAHFRDDADGFPRQAAFWSRTGWSQYLVLRFGD